MADRIGQQLGNYRLTRLLGQGGISDVYLAEHTLLKSYAAVKVLNMELFEDGLQSFISEARTIARLRHPHIVRILDFGVESERIPYIVMDYAPNGSLRTRHPKGTRLPLTIVIDYVKQVASALQYIHDQRLLHLAVKPGNMLIGANNEILLSEPAIAFVSLSMRTQTVTQEAIGTPASMAPEQFGGKPGPASDQYALGVTVYEWLSSTPPFQGDFFKIMYQHLSETPPSLRTKVPLISSSIEAVVMRALAKDPNQRFSSIQAFADALEGAALTEKGFSTPVNPLPPYTSQQPVTPPALGNSPYGYPQYGQTIPASRESSQASYSPASPPNPYPSPITAYPQQAYPPPPQLDKQSPQYSADPTLQAVVGDDRALPRKNVPRRRILIGGLVGLLGLAGAEIFARGNLSLQNLFPRANSVTPSPIAVNIGTTISVYTTHSDTITSVLWSNLVASTKLVVSASLDGTVQVWNAFTKAPFSLLRLPSGDASKIIGMAQSPDGKSIVAGYLDKQLRIWDVNSQQVTATQALSGAGNINGVSWSADSKFIAVASEDGAVYVFSFTSGISSSPTLLTSTLQNAATAVAWSPDARYLASAYADGSIAIWNSSISSVSKASVTYSTSTTRVNALAWSPDSKYLASAYNDATVHIHGAVSGELLSLYTNHTSLVHAVTWSPDGKYIASGSADKTVQLWNATNGEQMLYTYKGHGDAVTAVAWSPDGKYIASGSQDKTVHVWRAS